MRKLFSFILCPASLVFGANAALTTVDSFATGGTAVSTTLSYAVISGVKGTARVQYLNATSDKAGSKITFYSAGTPNFVSATSAASQAVITVPNAFGGSEIVVVHNVANDTYQRLVLTSATSTNATATTNLSFALAVGDQVYVETAAGTIPVGAATKEVNAASGAVYNGQNGKPLLIDLDGTSAVTVNVVSGIFVK